ncbi:MAG: hypothetical protein AB7I33_08795 [Gemmatimonadales bacterium]
MRTIYATITEIKDGWIVVILGEEAVAPSAVEAADMVASASSTHALAIGAARLATVITWQPKSSVGRMVLRAIGVA